jgi:hypothetical protein
MFFLPHEAGTAPRVRGRGRGHGGARGSRRARLGGRAGQPGGAARRARPRAARRPSSGRRSSAGRPGLGEEGWFACRYLLRLALDENLPNADDFALCSLSNRTVVYKGLAELSRVGELYPGPRDELVASRFVLFHSRYSTNTTTAWRRAQPFWGLAHNGEIATIRGNVAWMHAIGQDLVRKLIERHPTLRRIGSKVRSIICGGGSDSANLDDMLLSLIAGGMSMPQALIALLPRRRRWRRPSRASPRSTRRWACCSARATGRPRSSPATATRRSRTSTATGLRPLWITTTRDYALASSSSRHGRPGADRDAAHLRARATPRS